MLGQGTGYLSSGQWGDDATMASSSFFPVPRLSQSKQASKQATMFLVRIQVLLDCVHIFIELELDLGP